MRCNRGRHLQIVKDCFRRNPCLITWTFASFSSSFSFLLGFTKCLEVRSSKSLFWVPRNFVEKRPGCFLRCMDAKEFNLGPLHDQLRRSIKQNPNGSRLLLPGTEYTENINKQYQVSMEACIPDQSTISYNYETCSCWIMLRSVALFVRRDNHTVWGKYSSYVWSQLWTSNLVFYIICSSITVSNSIRKALKSIVFKAAWSHFAWLLCSKNIKILCCRVVHFIRKKKRNSCFSRCIDVGARLTLLNKLLQRSAASNSLYIIS